jgi:hypothetical protein
VQQKWKIESCEKNAKFLAKKNGRLKTVQENCGI